MNYNLQRYDIETQLKFLKLTNGIQYFNATIIDNNSLLMTICICRRINRRGSNFIIILLVTLTVLD